ncbi:MAG: nuclear transport factor 2 family protein [Anaerolineae bacterium]|nr:nuclear transport factor 2 family protein [Anaerolineae bacterium]
MAENQEEREIWDALHRHLRSIFAGDAQTYTATAAEDLSLYEWFIVPHRQDGLPIHLLAIEHGWAGTGSGVEWRYDLLEPRLQRYGDTAIVCYTFLLTRVAGGDFERRYHNESRVLVKFTDGWKVVHVHKSPAQIQG